MKLKLLLFLLFITGLSWGQNVYEDFNNVPILTNTSSYLTRSWINSASNITWTSTESRTDQLLNSKALCFRGGGVLESSSYANGMGNLSFNFVRGFTNSVARSFKVYVNNVQLGNTIIVSPSSNNIAIFSYVVNVAGPVVLRIEFVGGQINIDDISWNDYPPCTPPSFSGTLTSVNNCGNSIIYYNNPDALPTNELYWQTSATGTSFTTPYTGSRTITSSGTYYLRRYSGNCWSDALSINTIVNSIPNMSGNLSVTNITCNTSQIIYSASSETGLYWQTTANGESTTNPYTPLTVNTTGTYFIRRLVNGCWSDAKQILISNFTQNNITSQPVNASVLVGNTATFSVTSFYTSGVSYQWQVLNGSFWQNISGATSSSYNFTNAQLIDSGKNFRVLVTDVCGELTSNVVILSVVVGPCYALSFDDITVGSTSNSNTIITSLQSTDRYSNGGLYEFNSSYVYAAGGAIRIASGNNDGSFLIKNLGQASGNVRLVIKAKAWNALENSFLVKINANDTIPINNVDANNFSDYEIYYPNLNINSSLEIIALKNKRIFIDDIKIFCTPVSGPTAVVYGNGNVINNGSSVISLTDSTNFGTVQLGQTAQNTFTIFNIGTSDLDITNTISLMQNNGFVILNQPTSIIAPNGSTTFTIQFTATSTGSFINTVSIPSNDTVNNPYTFMIKAQVIDPNAVNTIYNPGELVFVGFDAQVNGSGTTDGYLIATMKDMKPGTSFSIVNSRYEAGAAAGIRSDKWGGSGDDASKAPGVVILTYNGNAIIPAGSVLEFKTSGFGGNVLEEVRVAISNTISTITDQFSYVLPDFNNVPNISSSDADQIYLIQGEFVFDGQLDANQANYILNGTLLHGLTNRKPWVDLYEVCSGSTQRESRLPEVLKCFNVENLSTNAVSGYYRNSSNHGLATLRELVLAIGNDDANWNLGTGRYSFAPSNAINSAAGKCFDINLDYLPVAGKWLGSSVGAEDNWFACGNWDDMKVPSQETDVLIQPQTYNPVIYQTNNEYPFGAFANNITIHNNATLSMPYNTSILKVSGNWNNMSNAGAFLEGSGTVVLNGTQPQIINSNAIDNVEKFFNLHIKNDYITSVSGLLEVGGDLEIFQGKRLIISPNTYLEVQNNITNNGYLKVESNGQLVQINNNAVNIGPIDFEMKSQLKKWDYSQYTTPVNTFNVYNFSPNTLRARIYEWVPTVNSAYGTYGNWINPQGTMVPGKGYSITAPNNFSASQTQIFTGTFTGIPNNGLYQVQINRGLYVGADYLNALNNVYVSKWDDNYNLIGNPYPSAISADQFLIHNQDKLVGPISIWQNLYGLSTENENPFFGSYQINYNSNSFLNYNLTGSTAGPNTFNGFIAGGQGFFVTVSDDGTNTTDYLEFTNQMRSKNHVNQYVYRNSNLETKIWLDLTQNNNLQKRILIGYIAGASNHQEKLFDAVESKHLNNDIYSMADNSTESLSIQGRTAPLDVNDRVKLGFNFSSSGNYSIGMPYLEGQLLNDEQVVILEDKLLNFEHNLKTAPYHFSSVSGRFEDRFVIKYQNTTLSTPDYNIHDQVIVHGQQQLTLQSNNQNIKQIQVYNVLGQMLDSYSANSTTVKLTRLQKNNTTLVLYIQLENGQKVTKQYIY